METILIVDDEPGIRLSLRYALQKEGFNVEEAVDGAEAIGAFHRIKPDLIVLDIKMPLMNGYDVCQKLRKESTVPIIFLSSKEDEVDQLQGYKSGIYNVDYVVKDGKYSPTVFAAMVRSKLPHNRANSLQHKHIHVDLETYKSYWGTQEVDLTPKEFYILRTMLQAPHKVHSRNSLKERPVEDITIDSHVRGIRRKFKEVNGGHDPIVSAKGHRGFVLYEAKDN